MQIAISREAFYSVIGGQVIQLPWQQIVDLGIDPSGSGVDRFLIAADVDGQQRRFVFDINVPGQSSLPLLESFLASLIETFKATRTTP